MLIHRVHKPGTQKSDKIYIYTYDDGKVVVNLDVLDKIKKMAIPPAYVKVKINLSPSAKIIYEGYDEKNRLQQKYSKRHTDDAKKIKFCRLLEFGKSFTKIQSDINHNLKLVKLTQDKIIAIILQIIWRCGFRVGNVKYQHLYESHGISNIFKRHITFVGKVANIEFKGKKGVINKCTISDANIVHELKTLVQNKSSGDYVFTYDDNILIRSVDINKWLGKYGKISSKDLRTFDVNVMFIDYIRGADLKSATTEARRKKIAKGALNETSCHINNTACICKSSYLMCEIYDMFITNPKKYKKYFLGSTNSRVAFMTFLKDYCKIE